MNQSFDSDSEVGNDRISSHHLLQQGVIPANEIIDSITAANASERTRPFLSEDGYYNSGTIDDDDTNRSDIITDQPSIEQVQRVYYKKGLEELESLKLLDLSPLANWKLSSFKQGFGIHQLRDDTPDTYWQSDGSHGSNNANSSNNGIITNNELTSPHSITIQFSKKVPLERISMFTNYNLDESYTPSKIKILAGSSDGWDLNEVCTVNFNKPVGWSHIIFNGIRNDGVLKCFMVKLIILANHQDGKDTHIRSLKCFGKKSFQLNSHIINNVNNSLSNEEILKDLSLTSASGYLLNLMATYDLMKYNYDETEQQDEDEAEEEMDKNVAKYLNNASNIIGFNTGFQSIVMKSVSSIR